MQSLLRRQLAQAVMLRVPKGAKSVFVGEGDRLGFAAPGPSQTGVGGLYLYEIFAEPAGEAQDLVLRWQIHRPDLEFPLDGEDSKTRVLLKNVESLQFRYFGDIENKKDVQWNESWSEAEILLNAHLHPGGLADGRQSLLAGSGRCAALVRQRQPAVSFRILNAYRGLRGC